MPSAPASSMRPTPPRPSARAPRAHTLNSWPICLTRLDGLRETSIPSIHAKRDSPAAEQVACRRGCYGCVIDASAPGWQESFWWGWRGVLRWQVASRSAPTINPARVGRFEWSRLARSGAVAPRMVMTCRFNTLAPRSPRFPDGRAPASRSRLMDRRARRAGWDGPVRVRCAGRRQARDVSPSPSTPSCTKRRRGSSRTSPCIHLRLHDRGHVKRRARGCRRQEHEIGARRRRSWSDQGVLGGGPVRVPVQRYVARSQTPWRCAPCQRRPERWRPSSTRGSASRVSAALEVEHGG